jgi:hypothetical protein
MKFLILTLLLSSSISVFAQSEKWDETVAKRFYSKIKEDRNLDCCDLEKKAKIIRVEMALPVLVYPRHNFCIDEYKEQALDSTTLAEVVSILERKYFARFSKKQRSALKRSCYTAHLQESIFESVVGDYLAVDAHLTFTVKFQ